MSTQMLSRLVAVLATATSLVAPRVATATEVGGGGSPRVDCLTTFQADVNTPMTKPRSIRCNDGDSNCDLDGVVNGQCNFKVAVCANSTFNPSGCSVAGVRIITVDHAADNGDPKFDPEFQALQTRIDSEIGPFPNNANDVCTAATNFFVTVSGPLKDNKCKKGKKQIRLVTESTVAAGMGTILVDKDKIDLVCDPPLGGCDPGQMFSSTYDRVQRQIFDQNCAVSGCHDSNSFMNSAHLLLEASAFPGNLINVTPNHADAAALGWKRIFQIDSMTGDTDKSFILHKVNGDFPSTGDFGVRMPKDHPKLDTTLINVLTLWIQAGAPQMGWVPGTD